MSDKRFSDGTNNGQKTWFILFDRHRFVFITLILCVYLLINNGILATSVWMEATREGATPAFSLWEPFVWEYTSALSTLLLLPLLVVWFDLVPLRFARPWKQVTHHILGTIMFSAAHVALMVAMREAVYYIAGGDYQFGNLYVEFFYEYRKDAWSYLFWMMLFYIYRFVYARLKGEASMVDAPQNQDDAPSQDPEQDGQSNSKSDYFLIKKLDKEFLVHVNDIEWVESAGNYVNLHSQGRIYPLRVTMAKLMQQLSDKGFCRVHRSFGVNLSQVESIEPTQGGDAIIHLRNERTLPLSRRYKDGLKSQLSC